MQGMRTLFERLEGLAEDDMDRELRRVGRLDNEAKSATQLDIRALYREAGAASVLDALWRDPSQPEGLRLSAEQLLTQLGVEEGYLRQHAVGILQNPEEPHEIYLSAVLMLGRHGKSWVLPVLLDAFESAPRKIDWWRVAGALAGFKNSTAIPTMIGVIQADNGYHSKYGIGYFGLHRLTGVSHDKSHDGAWWGTWWEENKDRFGADAAGMEIPRLRPSGRQP